MDSIEKIKGAKIIDIIKVDLEGILLELYFNIEYLNERLSFKLSISDDGETILFSLKNNWIALNDINYETYSVIKVNKDESPNLLGNEISEIQFGIGKTLDTNKEVIYYIRINTNENEFLFFNNGDNGAYSFDRIKAILENEIYEYEWFSKPPMCCSQ